MEDQQPDDKRKREAQAKAILLKIALIYRRKQLAKQQEPQPQILEEQEQERLEIVDRFLSLKTMIADYRIQKENQSPQYLNEFHKKNSEGVINHIEESKKSPIGFEEAQRQILRNLQESNKEENLEIQKQTPPTFINEFHRKNYEGAMKHIEESKKSPMTFDEIQKEVLKNSKDNL